jgi:trehalose/maltose hydrolase-like predicted phosphorylase
MAHSSCRYIGTAVAAAGPFFEKDVNQTNHALPNSNDSTVKEGWPLWNDRQTFSTVSGFYDCQDTTPGYNYKELRDRGCESVISGIPHPVGLHLVVGDQILNSTVDKNSISNFSQTMDFRNGVLSWTYTWAPNKTKISFDIEYEAFMSRARLNIGATRLRVTPHGGNYNASIIDLLDGRSAVRSSLGKRGMYPDLTSIYVSIHPDGLPNVTAWTISSTNVSNGYTDESSRRLATNTGSNSSMSIGQEWDARLVEGETATFEKLVGIASTDKFQDPESTARSELARAGIDGWDTILSEHTEAWNELMENNQMTNYRDPATGRLPGNDTIIEKFQIMAVGDYFYLMQNLLPANGNGLNDNGVSVGGLTSDTYGGMLFWDQEVFMSPGITSVRPDYGTQFLLARAKDYRQALQNAQEDYVQAKYKFDNKSVLYSWVRGRFGNATATGPVLNYEYHINLDIALAMWEYRQITGNNEFFKENFWDVFEGVGHAMATVLVKDGAGWSIRNMTDPDEYAVCRTAASSIPCSFFSSCLLGLLLCVSC